MPCFASIRKTRNKFICFSSAKGRSPAHRTRSSSPMTSPPPSASRHSDNKQQTTSLTSKRSKSCGPDVPTRRLDTLHAPAVERRRHHGVLSSSTSEASGHALVRQARRAFNHVSRKLLFVLVFHVFAFCFLLISIGEAVVGRSVTASRLALRDHVTICRVSLAADRAPVSVDPLPSYPSRSKATSNREARAEPELFVRVY